MAEYSKEPDAVFVHCQLNNAARTFSLQQKEDGTWEGKVDGNFLVPGELKSYFEAREDGDNDFYPDGAPQETIITKVIQVTPIEKIKLVYPGFPKEINAGYSATVSIGITKDSVIPERVTLYAAPSKDKEFFSFSCTQSTNKRWKVTIPASLLIPGTCKLYFYAEAKGSSGALSCRYPSSDSIKKPVKYSHPRPLLHSHSCPQTAKSGRPIHVTIKVKEKPPNIKLLYFRGRNINANKLGECFMTKQSEDTWSGSIPGNQVFKGTFLGHFVGIFEVYPSQSVELCRYHKGLQEIPIQIK
jgi:hypothetical protein